MLAQIGEYRPDLVVKDVHHEPLLRRMLLHPLDWQLLRECPSPLLLVGSLKRAVPTRVIAAIDVSGGGLVPSHLNRKIMSQALTLAQDCNAELHIAYVFTLPVNVPGDFAGTIYSGIMQADRRAFDGLADEYRIPRQRAHLCVGAPASELLDLASRKSADVIVIGASHHQWIARMVMGTTAEAVLERAPCDVLAIKPDQRSMGRGPAKPHKLQGRQRYPLFIWNDGDGGAQQ